jgi:hypothetical protein
MMFGCGFNANAQTGPVQTGPNQNAGVYFERTLFGVRAGIVGPESVKATKIEVNKQTGAVLIEQPEILAKPVEFTDAQTRKMSQGLLLLSQENTNNNKVLGENAVAILEALGVAAQRFLDAMPAGQLRQAVVGVTEKIAEAVIEAKKIEAAKAAASQPAE